MNDRKGPLPLVLGVTGHRDLRPEDEEPLRQRVQEIFRELHEKYPSTPLHLLSGLAEGADRLAAHVAANKANNVELLACLPMKRSLYETDFQTSESLNEFDQLLKKAVGQVELPLADYNTTAAVAIQGAPRDEQYQALGRYLTDHCQILIALWDGTDSTLPGGASWVVQLQLGQLCSCGETDVDRLLEYPESGPVYHIVTPRIKNVATVGQPYARREIYHEGFESQDVARKFYSEIFARIEKFNSDSINKRRLIRTGLAQSKDLLVPKTVRTHLPPQLEQLFEIYGHADRLAIWYQRRTTRSMRFLFLVYAVVAVICFVLFTEDHVRDWLLEHVGLVDSNSKLWSLVSYLLIIGIAVGTYWWARAHQLKPRYLDYRALAEGLRVQLFWLLAGLDDSVARHYLAKQKSELDWIRNAIRAATATFLKVRIPANLRLVQQYWVEEQLRFFSMRSKRDFQHHKHESRWTWAPVISNPITGMAVVIAGILASNGRLPYLWLPLIYSAGTILMVILPTIGGAYLAYSARMAFNEQWKQYRRMRNLYARAAACLTVAMNARDDGKSARDLVRSLGKEALEENGDWVLLHRERQFEVRL